MKRLLALSTALALALGASQASLAQGRGDDKPGKGHGGPQNAQRGHDDGRGKGDRGKEDRGRGDGPGRPDRGGPDRDRADRGRDDAGRPERMAREEAGRRGDDRRDDRGRGWEDARQERASRPDDGRRDWDRPDPVRVAYRDWDVIRGCPPGLAKKGNGCLPPGQAKKIDRVRYDFRWSGADGRYVNRYDDGYLYRYDDRGSLLGYLPALGGALFGGQVWPAQYDYAPAPRYQIDYFGLSQPYDYRYADGALYAVDRQTSTIQQVVALLTGQSLAVGQRMPAGYDIYNVPYAYRDRYVDSAAAAYRYNDGAIYQLDPTTQVIQAVIQLLT